MGREQWFQQLETRHAQWNDVVTRRRVARR